MASVKLDAWLAAGQGVAAKRPLADLGKRRYVVPMETVLFVRYADGQQRLFQPGEEVDTRDQGVGLLARTTPVAVPFDFDQLATQDDQWINAVGRLSISVMPKTSELASLLDRGAGAGEQVTTADVRQLIDSPACAALKAYCSGLAAEELTKSDHARAVETAMRDELKRTTFTYGLDFLGLDQLRMTSRRKGRPKRVVLERARQFLLASGKQVLVFDPVTCGTPNVAYEFSGRLGPLRSVRVVWLNGERFIAGGGRDGVYLITAGGTGAAWEYPLPRATKGRSGVNAVAVHGDRLYATHSEHGLTAWMLSQPGRPGETASADLVPSGIRCRQVQTTNEGRLILGAGRTVLVLNLATPAPPTVYRGAAGEVSAIAFSADALYAGTDRGEVLRWRWDTPETPAPEILRKGHAIYGLALVYLDAIPHLLIGAKDYGVTALHLAEMNEVLYQSPRWPVSSIAGASDYLAGLDDDRTTVLLWDAANPAKPSHTVPVRPLTGHSVQDLVCWKEEAPAEKKT